LVNHFNVKKQENTRQNSKKKKVEFKKEALDQLLKQNNLSKNEIAAKLGISRSTLWRKLKKRQHDKEAPIN